MTELNRFSVAIYPPEPEMSKVRDLKDQLASVIGNYGSRNSKAHITICEFNTDGEAGLLTIKSQLRKHCITESSLSLKFDHIGKYENKVNSVICLLPDNASELILKPFMKRIHKGIKVKLNIRSYNPHITIGRRLDEEKLASASNLFTSEEISFICDRIVLRVFDPTIRQFVVIEEFVFQSKPLPSDEQLSMF